MELYKCRQRCIRQNRSIFLYHFHSKVWKMADNPLTCEVILGNYGHPDHLKLDNILDPPDPDEDEIHIMRLSHYFPIEELPKLGLAKIPTYCCYNWAALHVFSQGKQCSSHGGLITYRYYHRQHIPQALWQQLQGKYLVFYIRAGPYFIQLWHKYQWFDSHGIFQYKFTASLYV